MLDGKLVLEVTDPDPIDSTKYANLSKEVRQIAKDILDVFKITKLDKILTIYPDEQAGLQGF